MRFIVDAQLPPALARWLVDQGQEASHVGDLGMQAASDRTIWDHALQEGVAIITKDEDFAQRKVLAASGPHRGLGPAAEHAPARSIGLVRGCVARCPRRD